MRPAERVPAPPPPAATAARAADIARGLRAAARDNAAEAALGVPEWEREEAGSLTDRLEGVERLDAIAEARGFEGGWEEYKRVLLALPCTIDVERDELRRRARAQLESGRWRSHPRIEADFRRIADTGESPFELHP